MQTESESASQRSLPSVLRATGRRAETVAPGAVEVGHAAGLWLVRPVHPRLTFANVEGFVARVGQLVGRGARRIVVDLGSVRDIDGAGVGALAEVHRLVVAQGGRVLFARAVPLVRRLIETSRLDRVLGLTPRVSVTEIVSAH
jgi:anti-anti-sigma factor